MKTLNVTFEDKDWEKLEKVKGGKTWYELIMQLVDE